MRRFAFEVDIYETLSCVPMAVREKLDRAAIKISLEQWNSFDIADRRRLCGYPLDSEQLIREFTETIRSLVMQQGGGEPPRLSREQQAAAFPTDRLPERVAANACALGFDLSPEVWTRLDDQERYALLKLGGGQRVKRNFEPALREFLEVSEQLRQATQ